jgi:DNA modification methylase
VSVQVLRGNALALPLADDSVDLVVTSPPYFGLRSYQDGGEHYDGQIGSEATPAEFVDALIAATAEMVRVGKPSGSIWVNLGDKYAGSRMDGSSGWATAPLDHDTNKAQLSKLAASQGNLRTRTTIPTKSLIGVPWRYALRCIDDLGLILRAEVIWSKPNGLPESVTDRVRRSHETWFHFTLNPRYYSAVDEIREEHGTDRRGLSYADRKAEGSWSLLDDGSRDDARRGAAWADRTGGHTGKAGNPLGKLPGSVWTIPTQPLTVPTELGVDHFAAFPMEWPRRIVTGWSPREVCTACGEGRRPVVHTPRASDFVQQAKYEGQAAVRGGLGATSQLKLSGGPRQRWREKNPTTLTGYACACPDTTAPATPGTVLDPFGGTGTTALVAHALGRHGISVDMSADYCRLAEWRTSDPKELARAQQREYVPPREQVDGQDAFDFGEEAS